MDPVLFIVEFTRDSIPPVVTILSESAVLTKDSTTVFRFSSRDVHAVFMEFSICTVEADTNLCVSDTRVTACSNHSWFNGSGCSCDAARGAVGGSISCAHSLKLGPMVDGTHSFTLFVTDAAGNTGSAVYTWTVDSVAPETQLLAGPAAESSSGSALFSFGCSDGEGLCSFKYILDPSAVPPPDSEVWSTLSAPAAGNSLPVTETSISVLTPVHADVPGNPVSSSTVTFRFSLTTVESVEFEYILCPGLSCTTLQLLSWKPVGAGQSVLTSDLLDGPYQLLARVSGTSVSCDAMFHHRCRTAWPVSA